MTPIIDRIMDRIAFDHGCWRWLRTHSSQGYAIASIYPVSGRRVHRLVYEALVGPIADGQQIDHMCRNRGCVNPLHLEIVTPQENTLRGVGVSAQHAQQTHCKNGHEFSVENTRIWNRKHMRQCRQCDRERWQRRKATRST